eukprot:TRINITY_DN9268_c0_g2_i1.p1 TRINITY_DN9268_c0_g2~~TRINITY_DN9268_c0_g2_i1.p1  ORF type:complete len:116 (-),score=11.14 TRINITY_DN9268_c0_g2_i1:23-370(-)
MFPTDIFLCHFDGGFGVYDLLSDQYSQPPNDTSTQGCSYDVIASSGFQSDYLTSCKFTRKLDTGDSKCDAIIKSGPYDIIWAFGQSNEFTYHGFTNRGATKVTFFDSPLSAPTQK